MPLPRPFSGEFIADALLVAIANNGYGIANRDMWEYIIYYELLGIDEDGRYYATARGRELMDRYPPVETPEPQEVHTNE
jgi:hypothetical protein